MECNAGCIGKNNRNDLKKRMYFSNPGQPQKGATAKPEVEMKERHWKKPTFNASPGKQKPVIERFSITKAEAPKSISKKNCSSVSRRNMDMLLRRQLFHKSSKFKLPRSITTPAANQTEFGMTAKSSVQASAPEEMVSIATTRERPKGSPER